MRHTFNNTTPQFAKIVIVPIIDVALVLVIVLLISAPMVSMANIPVSLPLASSRGAEDEPRITITLGKGGELALDEKTVSVEALPVLLRAQLEAGREDMLVVVRADQDIPYSLVRDIISKAREAGARRLAIATRQKVQP
jgi:biopolymer transport protein ExbD